MTPPTAPQLDPTALNTPDYALNPDYPVGLGSHAPDDLGDWWLDLGAIDLPGTLAV